MRRKPRPSQHVRSEIASRAARLVVDGNAADFDSARRKAARELGIEGTRDLPDNLELHRAVADHLMLFHGAAHSARITHLRACALAAMEFFTPFDPRLTGPVLYGTACEHAAIDLHLFSDETEAVTRFLLEHRCPYELSQRQLRVAGLAGLQRLPLFKLELFDERFEVVVLPRSGAARQPLSALDGKPVKRAGAKALRALLESGQTIAVEHSYA